MISPYTTTHECTARVGIVGLGNMGQIHAARFQQAGYDIVAGADIDPSAREQFANEFDVNTGPTYEVLREANAGTVVVTTPPAVHEQPTVAALKAGCDVLVEKPLASEVDDGRRIAAAARDSNGTCTVGFHNRFQNTVTLLRQYLKSGHLGNILHIEATYVRKRGVPQDQGWMTDTEIAGGGALVDLGSHAIDLALYFADYPDTLEVLGETRSGIRNRDGRLLRDPDVSTVEEGASAFLQSLDGPSISVDVAWAANREPSATFVVRGTKGGARLQLDETKLTLYGPCGEDYPEDAVREHHVDRIDPYLVQARRIGKPAQDEGVIRASTASEAFFVQRVIDAVYTSAESNRSIRIRRTGIESAESTDTPSSNL